MKVPNGNQAVIDERKIYDYCLSREHDEGKHKARLFRNLLQLTATDAPRLIAALREAAARGDAVPGVADRYGQRYVIDFEMPGPAGKVVVRSARIVRTGEVVPRLVTCYTI
jgi:hypothetical protein